ncbi:18162_t:CDS:1, partial [Cetraspora pellucida]
AKLYKKASAKAKKQSKTTFELLINNNSNVDTFFDKKNNQFEELDKELTELMIEQNEVFFIEELFNFAMFKKDQELIREDSFQ